MKNIGYYHTDLTVNHTLKPKYPGQFHTSMVPKSTVRKKMAAVHFTTIPCEPNYTH